MMKIDVIGDIHGCFQEFYDLTQKLDYEWHNGYPIHRSNRKLAFVGDLADRGPQSIKVIEAVIKTIENKAGYYVPGNHCNKLYRYMLGNKVQVAHGLETTAAELESLDEDQRRRLYERFMELYDQSPLYHVLDQGRLVIAHAGIREDYIGKTHKKVKEFVLYGDITGQTNPDGTPVRRDWAKFYNGKAFIVYGHTPVREARFVGNTVNIDTGAVFGGHLTALRYPEKEIVSVKSSMPLDESRFREIE